MKPFKAFLLVLAIGTVAILFIGIIIHFLDTASTPFHSIQVGFWTFILWVLLVLLGYLIYLLEEYLEE